MNPLFQRALGAAGAAWDAAVETWALARAPRAAERMESSDESGGHLDVPSTLYGSATTPEVITQAVFERNSGRLAGWHDLADHAIRSSPHLATCLLVRCDSVVETDFAAEPGPGTNRRGAQRAADATNALMAEWRRTGLDIWLAEMVAARYYVAGLHEVLWERRGSLVAPVALRRVAERRLAYSPRKGVAGGSLELGVLGPVGGRAGDTWAGTPVRDFHPDKFLAHETRTLGGHRVTEGLFAGAVWYWLFGVISWRDLMRLQEMLGRQPIVGYYATGGELGPSGARGVGARDGAPPRVASPEERALLRQVVNSMNISLRAALPDTTRLDKLTVDVPSQPLHALTADRCNALLSKLFLGTTGVIDIVPGSRAAQETAYESSHTFWRSDCRYTARELTRLAAMFVRANPDYFGEACPLPEVKAQTEAAPSTKEAADAIGAALEAGVEVPRAWAHRVLKIPQRVGDESVLGAPSKPATLARAPIALRTRAALAAAPRPAADAVPVAIVLPLPADVAALVALPGGEAASDLHVTLCYLGKLAMTADDVAVVERAVRAWAAWVAAPVAATLSGVGRFAGDPEDGDAVYLSVDAPGLTADRPTLVELLRAAGFPPRTEHGFTAHVTVAYVPAAAASPLERVAPRAVTFDQVALWAGDRRTTALLAAPPPATAEAA
jgi:2'-5' RNA ligase